MPCGWVIQRIYESGDMIDVAMVKPSMPTRLFSVEQLSQRKQQPLKESPMGQLIVVWKSIPCGEMPARA